MQCVIWLFDWFDKYRIGPRLMDNMETLENISISECDSRKAVLSVSSLSITCVLWVWERFRLHGCFVKKYLACSHVVWNKRRRYIHRIALHLIQRGFLQFLVDLTPEKRSDFTFSWAWILRWISHAFLCSEKHNRLRKNNWFLRWMLDCRLAELFPRSPCMTPWVLKKSKIIYW